MIKSPIQKVTENLQNRAIGIIYGSYKPLNTDSLNKGIIKDQNNLSLDAVVLGKTLTLNKKYIDFNKKYFLQNLQHYPSNLIHQHLICYKFKSHQTIIINFIKLYRL